MFIIKLGGSVITDKSIVNCFRKEIFNRLANEIKKADKTTIIVHGAGSFGHILAKKFNLNNGLKNKDQLHGFCLTHAMVQKLNSLVLDSLHNNGVSAVSIPPHSILMLSNKKIKRFDYNIFKDYIEIGFTPVTFGDIVLDVKLGFSICSGDLLVNLLAKYFHPERVIFVIDEDGLYTSNPKINKNAKLIENISLDKLIDLSTTLDSHADVTGGMAGKISSIKNLAELGIESVLLNGNKPDRLYKVLVGKKTKSTKVFGDK